MPGNFSGTISSRFWKIINQERLMLLFFIDMNTHGLLHKNLAFISLGIKRNFPYF